MKLGDFKILRYQFRRYQTLKSWNLADPNHHLQFTSKPISQRPITFKKHYYHKPSVNKTLSCFFLPDILKISFNQNDQSFKSFYFEFTRSSFLHFMEL